MWAHKRFATQCGAIYDEEQPTQIERTCSDSAHRIDLYMSKSRRSIAIITLIDNIGSTKLFQVRSDQCNQYPSSQIGLCHLIAQKKTAEGATGNRTHSKP